MDAQDYFKLAMRVICGFNGYMGDMGEDSQFGRFFSQAVALRDTLELRVVIPGEWVLLSTLPRDSRIRYKIDDQMSHLPSFILVESRIGYHGVLFWLAEPVPLDVYSCYRLWRHYDPTFHEQPALL